MYKLKLIELGIPADMKGFEYLNTALELYEPLTTSIIGLYRALAHRHKTSKASVERAIRQAIKHTGKKMANGNFIATHKILWSKEVNCDRERKKFNT